MRVCNAGQPNLQEHVPRVSLIYRGAPVNYAKRDALCYSFCILFRGTIFEFFKIPKNVLAIPPIAYYPIFCLESSNVPFKVNFFFQNPVFRGRKKSTKTDYLASKID